MKFLKIICLVASIFLIKAFADCLLPEEEISAIRGKEIVLIDTYKAFDGLMPVRGCILKVVEGDTGKEVIGWTKSQFLCDLKKNSRTHVKRILECCDGNGDKTCDVHSLPFFGIVGRKVNGRSFEPITKEEAIAINAPVSSGNLTSRLYVTSEPMGAEVFVDEQLRGISPASIEIPAKIDQFNLRVTKSGYLTTKLVVDRTMILGEKIHLKLEKCYEMDRVGRCVYCTEPLRQGVCGHGCTEGLPCK